MRAFRKGIFSAHYVVEDGDDSIEVRVSPWHGSVTFEYAGATYELRRHGLFFGAFTLERDGEVLASADKRLLQSAFDIEIGDYACSLRGVSLLGRQFGLFEDAELVGSIGRTGFFGSEIVTDLYFIHPLPAKVFVLWLALLLWKREAAASSGD